MMSRVSGLGHDIAHSICHSKELLQTSFAAHAGVNPFAGYTPSVPAGERLDFASERFLDLEQQGITEAGHTAFVLVAGGLGERLGYAGTVGVARHLSCSNDCI